MSKGRWSSPLKQVERPHASSALRFCWDLSRQSDAPHAGDGDLGDTPRAMLPQLPRCPVAQASGQNSRQHVCKGGERAGCVGLWERVVPAQGGPVWMLPASPGPGGFRSSWAARARSQGPEQQREPPLQPGASLRPGTSPSLTGQWAPRESRRAEAVPCPAHHGLLG